jgi:two-component SAPR family response regulator
MRILIVEDETVAYENIVDILSEIDPAIVVAGNSESIKQTVKWMQNNTPPDLILMDIHLSDGSAFSIFDHVKIETPIIFTTAYDEYAIEAFKVNSVDYLLKPIKK